MTTVVLSSSYLSASLLSMLVPIAGVSAVVAWGVILIRRYERHREHVVKGDRSAAATEATEGSRPARGD